MDAEMVSDTQPVDTASALYPIYQLGWVLVDPISGRCQYGIAISSPQWRLVIAVVFIDVLYAWCIVAVDGLSVCAMEASWVDDEVPVLFVKDVGLVRGCCGNRALWT
jgi:hypothetical protein